MTSYWLTRHVSICVSGDRIVLLDLKADRYLTLSPEHACALEEVVQGWPASPQAGVVQSGREQGCDLAKQLQACGILTADPREGKSATFVASCRPEVSLLDSTAITLEDARPACRYLAPILSSVLRARLQTMCVSLERIVRTVTQRRDRRGEMTPASQTRSTTELVHAFHAIRPFVFNAQAACLFNSLALLHFLAQFNRFPNWVFGVRTTPFAAHCWIQDGNTVLDDTVEHVSTYTPILIV